MACLRLSQVLESEETQKTLEVVGSKVIKNAQTVQAEVEKNTKRVLQYAP